MNADCNNAHLVEVFSSLQGEGIYAGEAMTFVRFAQCSQRCRFCDTPQGLCDSSRCRVETAPRSGRFHDIANPVTATKLSEVMSGFSDAWVSVTGGEPLEQADFLAGWLPSICQARRVLLETNGIMHEELKMVLPYVHVVSMDIKLPSSTGCGPRWQEHSAFLRNTIAAGREIYVKLVVTPDTLDADIEQAINMVTRINRFIPAVIQPVTPTLKFNREVAGSRVQSVERLVSAYLEDVRVVPQMHKQWKIL